MSTLELLRTYLLLGYYVDERAALVLGVVTTALLLLCTGGFVSLVMRIRTEGLDRAWGEAAIWLGIAGGFSAFAAAVIMFTGYGVAKDLSDATLEVRVTQHQVELVRPSTETVVLGGRRVSVPPTVVRAFWPDEVVGVSKTPLPNSALHLMALGNALEELR